MQQHERICKPCTRVVCDDRVLTLSLSVCVFEPNAWSLVVVVVVVVSLPFVCLCVCMCVCVCVCVCVCTALGERLIFHICNRDIRRLLHVDQEVRLGCGRSSLLPSAPTADQGRGRCDCGRLFGYDDGDPRLHRGNSAHQIAQLEAWHQLRGAVYCVDCWEVLSRALVGEGRIHETAHRDTKQLTADINDCALLLWRGWEGCSLR